MNFLKKSIYTVFLIWILLLIAIGQDKIKPNQLELWKSRADTITFTLIDEAAKIAPLKRSLIYAQMGNLWWKSDPNQSNIWFEKSVDTLIYNSNDDVESDVYFQTVSEILKTVSNRNQKQTARLINLLSETDKTSEKNKNANADTLIEFAFLIAKENPGRAFDIGTSAFRIGQPNDFYKLYWELRRYASTLADKFLKTAISSAISSPNPQIVANLKTSVFPETVLPQTPTEILSSNSIKTETLDFFSDYIIQQQAKLSGKSISSCEPEAFVLASLQNQFITLLPQKADIVRQAIGICLANKSQAARDLTTKNLQNEQDIDAILKLADEVKDNPQTRAYYLFRATVLANEQKKYKIATKILENMTEEERETDLEFWEELRYTVASGFAYQQFQENDLQSTNRTLEAVPANNRAFAKIGFALKFSPKDVLAREFILEKVREAQAELTKSEKSFTEKSGFWFQIIKIYSNYSMTAEAAEAFREIVKDFNKSFSDNEVKNKPFISSEAINSVVSSDLLESQDNNLFQSAGLIKDENSRVQINLGFLKTALKKYEMLKPKDTKPLNKSVNSDD